jgi:uncharacterized protein YjgD (DUF1641 family)
MFDFHEDDDLFGGTAEKKYFDIIFNANRSVVENALSDNLRRMNALEALMEERLGDGEDLETLVRNYIASNVDRAEDDLKNAYIVGMGDILTQAE